MGNPTFTLSRYRKDTVQGNRIMMIGYLRNGSPIGSKGKGAGVEGVGLTLRAIGDGKEKKSHIAYLPWETRYLCGMKRCLRPLARGEEGWMNGWMDGLID